ncbi:MAG TPA: sigma 54-interacting transcriptional regulator [Longimicrobiaceae bacterium]|nr:sigma 54-interacting transcriptional regulator [Longimicrobiaceae bacterium]
MSRAPTPQEESDLARHLRCLAAEHWGERGAIALIGRHASLLEAQEKALFFGQADAPVLVTGETGTGKEIFARAVYLCSSRRGAPFVSVNCAHFGDNQLIASELFGHRRGSFTGAVADHRGVFEEADGGVVFLDEVGELSTAAQAMLLRVLSEGEIVRVGESRARRVDVRVVAATNRDLRAMVAAGQFREDLYYRLRFLHLAVPPLRERGDDWRLVSDFFLRRLEARSGIEKRLSPASLSRLGAYHWPGNVRELRGLMEMSHCLSLRDPLIEPHLFEQHLEPDEALATEVPTPAAAGAPCRLVPDRPAGIGEGEGDFWTRVYEPFMERDLSRTQVRALVEDGLRRSQWSYKRALALFGVAPDDYLKFMDFLRHHRLKPERA